MALEGGDGGGAGEAGEAEFSVGGGEIFFFLEEEGQVYGSVFAGQEIVDQFGFGGAFEGFFNGLLGDFGGNALGLEIAQDARAAEALVAEAGLGKGLGKFLVVGESVLF